MAKKSLNRPEIWGGVECSFNRVGDLYMDQLEYCGHYGRIAGDIEAIGSLGITAIRYPVIWERLQPSPDSDIDWSTSDAALNKLRHHGIVPLIGLDHHGSGPPYADLLSPSFAPALSTFAGKVAQRYPWIEYYTPINEPLTTARFSGLYGLWFPHMRSDHAFARLLINQVMAVALSMREIRKVNPGARLLQTEDLAKVYSTPRLQYQADFENQRRWLTWDLLCGKMDRNHPLWEYFVNAGIAESELQYFVHHPCPPDMIGADYYTTSERYLDETLERYPPNTHGANHFESYADVEAIRVRHGQPSGLKLLLTECWDRYRIPIAVTEAHINSDADDQIRWFDDVYRISGSLLEEGIAIEAVAAWALLGSYGWNTLLTMPMGDYELGAFDVRSGVPVATPLAGYLTQLAKDPSYVHPATCERGWWHREHRFVFEKSPEIVEDPDAES